MSVPETVRPAWAEYGQPTPTGPVDPQTESAQDGALHDQDITEIVDRLQRRYPDDRISRTDLEGRVRGFHREFDNAAIRTFVAVFVERLVRRSLDQPYSENPLTAPTPRTTWVAASS
jgi:hypothetical protein